MQDVAPAVASPESRETRGWIDFDVPLLLPPPLLVVVLVLVKMKKMRIRPGALGGRPSDFVRQIEQGTKRGGLHASAFLVNSE